jgi:hypothetical protein
VHGLNWILIAIGILIGISITAALIWRFGRAVAKKANLEDRGEWDRPLPEPVDKDMVVAVYKRRKDYHRHHRDHYRRRRRSRQQQSN